MFKMVLLTCNQYRTSTWSVLTVLTTNNSFSLFSIFMTGELINLVHVCVNIKRKRARNRSCHRKGMNHQRTDNIFMHLNEHFHIVTYSTVAMQRSREGTCVAWWRLGKHVPAEIITGLSLAIPRQPRPRVTDPGDGLMKWRVAVADTWQGCRLHIICK
jgi:hypothetical protein